MADDLGTCSRFSNMRDISIRSHLAVSYQLEQQPGELDAILILDSAAIPTDFAAHFARRHVYLTFDDAVAADRGKRLPVESDLRLALDFAAEADQLVVSCRAGQSRSAAIAFVVCFARLGAARASNLLDPTRHIPNALVIELGSRVLDDPSVLTAYHEWKTRHRMIRFADYLDEIEHECDELQRQGARNRIVLAP